MGIYTIENEILKVTARSKSAELISVIKKETSAEYLWNGDSKYWGWSSPILFPFVGKVRDQKYNYKGKTYEVNQHGFARNMEFDLVSQKENEIWFAVRENKETLIRYPFAFRLEIGYILEDNSIQVIWKVTNPGEDTMYFSIGAHPAFMCPLNEMGQQTDYYMGFETDKDEIRYKLIDKSCGLIAPEEYSLKLEEGLHRIEKTQFDKDALIIEGHQVRKMWLADPDKKPYVTVEFDAPLFGVWSPEKKNAPFICIEPWYGRSDGNDFYGSLEKREYGNTAQPRETVEKSYMITID